MADADVKHETALSQVTAEDDVLLAAWGKTRSRRGAQPAIFDRRGAVARTFSDIETEAAELERQLREQFRPGDLLGIQLGNDPSWPALFLACLRSSTVMLPLEQSISTAECERALTTVRANGLATSSDGVQLQRRAGDQNPWEGAPPVLLKLTSGTTAAPRGICFRSAQLLADCENICDTMGITATDRNFGVIPISHSYGLSNLLTPLLVRGVPLVLSRDRMPRAVLSDLAHTHATVFPGMPVFYQAFAGMPEVPPLPKLRLCISAGAPLQPEFAGRFEQKFARRIHSFYGSSECGGICFDGDGAASLSGAVGRPLQRVQIELLDAISPSSRISVRSDAVANGYFPEPDPDKLGNGEFRPDDLLKIEQGIYRIVGRASDLINVAGKKVNPAEVEAELLRFPGVLEAVVFGRASSSRNEEVAVCLVAPEVEEKALLEHCRTRMSGWHVPRRIFFVDALPVNERGKISRRMLAEKYRDS